MLRALSIACAPGACGAVVQHIFRNTCRAGWSARCHVYVLWGTRVGCTGLVIPCSSVAQCACTPPWCGAALEDVRSRLCPTWAHVERIGCLVLHLSRSLANAVSQHWSCCRLAFLRLQAPYSCCCLPGLTESNSTRTSCTYLSCCQSVCVLVQLDPSGPSGPWPGWRATTSVCSE